MEREFNNDMLNKTETIRCIRVQLLLNEEFCFLNNYKRKAGRFRTDLLNAGQLKQTKLHKHIISR